jgi:hypothetical protein
MNLKSIFGILCLSLIMMSCGSNDAEKFVGTWTGDVNCEGDISEDESIVFTLGAEDDELLLTIDSDTPQIKATANGDNVTLEKTRDDEGDGDYIEISGSGSINSDGNLVMTFQLEVYEDEVLEDQGTCLGTFSL